MTEAQTFGADPIEVFANVRRALNVAHKTKDDELEAHARSVMSLLVHQLTNRFIVFPVSMRESYEVISKCK